MELDSIICPSCGATELIEQGAGKYICKCCDTISYKRDNDTQNLLSQALTYLKMYKFADADELYCQIEQESLYDKDYITYCMAEWGRLQAELGIIYVKGFDKRIDVKPTPTFAKYTYTYASVKDCCYYGNIMSSKAPQDVKANYEALATKLDEDYKHVREELDKDYQYDVFVCAKISNSSEMNPDAEGETRDKDIALQLCDELKARGVSTFFSAKDCQGIKFDAQILSALARSKMLVVVATNKEHLESCWVQSEWRRWLNFIDREEKKKNSVILYLPDFDNEHFNLPSIILDKKMQCHTKSYYKTMLSQISEFVGSVKGKAVSKHIDESLYDNENYNNGEKYYFGQGVDIDYKEAFKYYKLAAEKGDPRAEYSLGWCYFYGQGVDKDYAFAISNFLKSANKGYSFAENKLGLCYYYGEGVDVDKGKALYYFQNAAEHGESDSMFRLGRMYYRGDHVPVDKERAVELYKKAADEGNNDAKHALALCYMNGDTSIEKDDNKGFNMICSLADNGHLGAKRTLGMCYALGRVVAKDTDKARTYFKEIGWDTLDVVNINLLNCMIDVCRIRGDEEDKSKYETLVDTTTYVIQNKYKIKHEKIFKYYTVDDYKRTTINAFCGVRKCQRKLVWHCIWRLKYILATKLICCFTGIKIKNEQQLA